MQRHIFTSLNTLFSFKLSAYTIHIIIHRHCQTRIYIVGTLQPSIHLETLSMYREKETTLFVSYTFFHILSFLVHFNININVMSFILHFLYMSPLLSFSNICFFLFAYSFDIHTIFYSINSILTEFTHLFNTLFFLF